MKYLRKASLSLKKAAPYQVAVIVIVTLILWIWGLAIKTWKSQQTAKSLKISCCSKTFQRSHTAKQLRKFYVSQPRATKSQNLTDFSLIRKEWTFLTILSDFAIINPKTDAIENLVFSPFGETRSKVTAKSFGQFKIGVSGRWRYLLINQCAELTCISWPKIASFWLVYGFSTARAQRSQSWVLCEQYRESLWQNECF